MERLTEHHVNKKMGVYMVCSGACDDFNCTDCEKFNEIVDRLAAYEDTGLEPGEVVAMKIVLLGRELAKITDVDGVSINRICELAQAEKDGRLMVLPPNDPLTLEELREMDGEPVWVEKNGATLGCALIYSPGSIVYITISAGTKWYVEDLLDEGCKFYRRKPEEEEKNAD